MQFMQGGPNTDVLRQRTQATRTTLRIPGSAVKEPIGFHKSVKPPHGA